MIDVPTPRRLIFPASAVPAAGGRSVISLPVGRVGWTYKQLDLFLTKAGGAVATDANIDTDVDRIQVLANGRPIIDMPGSDWMDLMGYDRAITADKGILPLRFGQLNSRTMDGEDEPALGTLDVDSLEVVIDWDAAAVVTGVQALGSCLPNTPLGQYFAWRKYNPTFNGAQEHLFDGVRLTERQALVGLHVKNANVSDVRVELGSERILEGKRAAVLDHPAREYEKVPNASWCHIDYAVMRRHIHSLPLGGTVRHYLTFSVDPAGAVTMYAKTVETWTP